MMPALLSRETRSQEAVTAVLPALTVDRLCVSSRGLEVLRNVSFQLKQGKTLGLIGESGAGKSMLGRAIARQLPAGFAVSKGLVTLGTQDILKLSHSAHRELLGQRIAFIPQEPMSALNPAHTIAATFSEHLLRNSCGKREIRSRTMAALSEVHLHDPENLLDKYPFQLSGGMCQRVLIALAFVSHPEVVIADEPTASLDVTTQAHIVRVLRHMQDRRGTGVLFITHQLGLAAHLCDEVAVLYSGEIVECGSASSVLSRPRHPYTYGLSGANPRFGGQRSPLLAMAGKMPSIAELNGLAGCRFSPRCASAVEICRTSVPTLTINQGHGRRCWLEKAAPFVEAEVQASDRCETLAADPILIVNNLSKSFPGSGFLRRKRSTLAVREVSFTVSPGEFIGIVGESGSGKSTLSRMIMGLDQPSGGQVVLDGEPLSDNRRDWQRRIAAIQYVFQDPNSALNPRRRLLSLVTQPLEATGASNAVKLKRALMLMQDIGMPSELLSRYPAQLSGGQKQRINIARALCVAPRILIADEIASGLDVSIQAQMLSLLRKLRDEYNVALLMISHDLAVVRYLCSRVIVMHRGHIVESGPTEVVFAAPKHPYTRELIAAIPTEDPNSLWPPPLTHQAQ
jgi:peptide/nickel transport system ATP-binding protein